MTSGNEAMRSWKSTPRYLRLVDGDGCRHLIRATAIQIMADADALQDATVLVAAGRTIHVPRPLDAIVAALDEDLDMATER